MPTLHRRDLLRAAGAATALALLPYDAADTWARVLSGIPPRDGLTGAQLARVGAIADVIFPRSDSPSATEVGVPAFVNVIVSENYSDAERATFVTNLELLNADAIDAIEQGDRRAEPARTYWRLKGLIVHGYFTSERVSKDVLHTEIMPGRFDGAAPMPARHG